MSRCQMHKHFLIIDVFRQVEQFGNQNRIHVFVGKRAKVIYKKVIQIRIRNVNRIHVIIRKRIECEKIGFKDFRIVLQIATQISFIK